MKKSICEYYKTNGNVFEEEVSNSNDIKNDNNLNNNSNNNDIKKGNSFRGLNILPGFGFPKINRNNKRQIYPHFIKKKNNE